MSTPNKTSIKINVSTIPPIMFSAQDSSPSDSNTDPPDQEITINSPPGDFEYVLKYNYTDKEEDTLRKIALIYQDEFNRTIFESKDALKTRLEEVGRKFSFGTVII
jgi:hypothetical protein